MSWRDNSDQLIPVNQGINMRNTAFTLFVLAFSLFFVSGVLWADTPSWAPHPAGTINSSKAGISIPSTAAGVDSSTCTTQSYAGAPVYFWPVPQDSISAFSMGFDAVADDTLKSVSFYVYNPGDGSFGNDTIYVRIYSDNGFGLPGTLLNTKTVPLGTYPAYPTACLVNYDYTGLSFRFHVSISTSAAVGSGRYESILSDSGTTGTGRSSYLYQGQWEPISPGSGPDYNFHIWVTTCHAMYPNSSISGHKYRDSNRDKQISGDLPLGGWQIERYQNGAPVPPPVYTQTGTGVYTFSNVPPGNYQIREVISPSQKADGWVQILPATVQQTVAVTTTGLYSGPDFLNDSCLDRTSQTYFAGTHDNFASPEPSSTSPGFHAYLLTKPTGETVLEQFDVPANDHWFGHTFDNLWNSQYSVVDARLCMRIAATDWYSYTDALYLGDWNVVSGGQVWGIKLSSLVNNLVTTTNQARDGKWDLYDTMTVCLDLADLPASGSYPRNIIASLQDGDLDVLIMDDTEIDWLELTVTFCCDSCESNTLTINTAYHPASGIMLPGTKDPDWVVGTAPVPGLTGPAKVVDWTSTGWLPPMSPSNWVTAKANSTNGPASTAAGDYIFEYCFCAADTLALLNMNIRTDNNAQVFLNSTLIPALTTSSTSFMLPPFSVTAWGQGFVTGGNVITAIVHNSELIMGLDVEGSVTANNLSLNAAECCSCFTDGDVNGNGTPLEIADLLYLIHFLQGTGPAMIPLFKGDLNGDCVVDSLDAQKYYDYFLYGMSVFPTYPIRTCCCLTATLLTYPQPIYTLGDANGDATVDISDAVFLIAYIFSGGATPDPLLAGDANCDGTVDISDVVYLIAYIFSGGAAPCAP
jgi:hypothetical protein